MKQIVFTFDTTGSMYPCLTQTRRSIVQTVERLFKEIPDLEVGVIAHGDYVDKNSTYVTERLDLTSDKKKIIAFVNGVSATGGGDSEECYELVLQEARKEMSWKAGATKVVVLIGDDVPHTAAEAKRQGGKEIDWKNELDLLLEADVKVYGVQALRRSHADNFYETIAKKTKGFHLHLDQFAHVQDLILAVAMKQKGDEYLSVFEQEVEKAGRMNRSLDEMFETLYGKTYKRPAASSKRYTVTTGGLKPVHPSRFQVLHVDRDRTIMEFVEDNGLTFKKGRGFYELTKAVKVQSYKEIILQDRKTGDFFTGDAARDLLGLPHGTDAKLSGEGLDKYRVFIQSTSVNRKLLGDTSFLYEVDESLR